jgi:pimeloyl-ACP methyl ester carboxylesterase
MPSDVRIVRASDGVPLQYEVLGAGAPVVLLHGGFTGRSAFSRQRVLSEQYRLIIPSSRGHDGTDNRLPADYGFQTTEVADLCAILNAEDVDRTHVIGHSSGGATAFALGTQHPGRVNHLVLIEPTLIPLLPVPYRQQTVQGFESIIQLGEREGDAAALRAAIAYFGGAAWSRLDASVQQARLDSLANLAPVTVHHGRGLLAFSIDDEDVRDLRPPTLLLYGTTSYDFEPAIAQRFRELRPDLPLVVVEGAGHNLHREQPDFVNSTIAKFLRSNISA